MQARSDRGLLFASNSIDGDAIITANKWESAAAIRGNESRKLAVSGRFARGLTVEANDARELIVTPDRQSRLPLLIDDNFVRTHLQARLGDGWSLSEEAADRRFSISDNSIGGLLSVTTLANGSRSEGGVETVDAASVELSGNKVSGDLHVSVPDWLRVANEGTIEVSGNSVTDETIIEFAKCPTDGDARIINLAGSATGRFEWDVPTTCDVLWSGSDFDFREWRRSPRFIESDGIARDDAILAWAKKQTQASPETLRVVSSYLLDRGYNEAGREILQDAKQILIIHDNPPVSR